MKRIYHVEGMSCSACAAAVERIVKKLEGIEQAQVNLVSEEICIEGERADALPYLNEALKKGGYVLEKKQDLKSQTFIVKNMTCASCSAAVERILKRFDEIESASVNLVMNTVSITYEKLNFDAWKTALEKGGFELVEESDLVQVVLDIEGMTCSSCSASIEKVVSRKVGVESVHVNLVMKQASITYHELEIKASELIQTIEKAGFHAQLHVDKQVQTVVRKDRTKMQIYITLGMAAVLLYIGMSHMLGSFELPLPSSIHYQKNPVNFALIQFVLSSFILIRGYGFFTRGVKALLHGSPNMDTLVAIGTGSAYLYSCYSLFLLIQGDVHAVHSLYFESAGVVVALVQFGKYLESNSKKKSTGAIQALLQLRPTNATLFREGKEIEIQVDEIRVGDVLVVKPGEHIAVDGVLIEGSASIDESMLTGESMPQRKEIGAFLSQGTIDIDGRILVKCSASQEDTTLAKIIHMVEEAQGKKAPIARIADRISLYFVPTVMVIATVSALLWFFLGKDITFALTIFVSVLVIACPCALGLATPTAIMVGTGKAAQFGIFIKSGEALETASTIDTIVFDKTGTITLGKPVVTDITTQKEEALVLGYAAALENGSKHPLATAILQKAQQEQIEYPTLSSIHTHNGLGLSAEIDGVKLFVGSRHFIQQQGYDTSVYLTHEERYLRSGKTVVWVSYGQEILGIIAIADKLKSDVKSVIAQLKKQQIEVYMMTGDHSISANAIAAEAGIEHVIAEVLPNQKGEEVKKLQAAGKKVAMVGDGINDAIALTQSEVGIAIGSGSDVAVESADIVLMKDTIQDVETAIRLSRSVIRNIKQNLFWAFFYNIIGIPIAAGLLYPFFQVLLSPVFAGAAMAFSSVSVVSNALRLRNFK